MTLRKHRIKTVAFGFLGTLLDDLAGMRRSLLDVAGPHRAEIDFDEMALAWWTALRELYRERYAPWPVKVAKALRHAFERAGLGAPDVDEGRVFQWIERWPLFDDVSALGRLGLRYEIAVLSQTDGESLSRCLPNFPRQPDRVVTSDLSRTFKPDPGYFKLLRVQLRLEEPDQLLVVSAARDTDLVPAAALGHQILHIDRSGAGEGAGDLHQAVAQLS